MTLIISIATLITLFALVLVLTGTTDKIAKILHRKFNDDESDEEPDEELPDQIRSLLSHYGYLYNTESGEYKKIYAGVLNGIIQTLFAFGKHSIMSFDQKGKINCIYSEDSWTQHIFAPDPNIKDILIMKEDVPWK